MIGAVAALGDAGLPTYLEPPANEVVTGIERVAAARLMASDVDMAGLQVQ